MSMNIVKMDKVATMYRAYVHMQYGNVALEEAKKEITDLKEGKILMITPRGGSQNAEKAYGRPI